jgi:PQQ-like domain
MSLTAAQSAPGATGAFTFTGTSGSLTHAAQATVNVIPYTPPAPGSGFTLSASPATITVDSAASGTDTQAVQIAATASNGFSGSVTVTFSGLPSGATVSPTTLTLVPGTPQTVMLSVPDNTPQGTTTINITGVSGSLTAMASLSLMVVPPPPPGASFLLELNPAALTLTPGGSGQPVAITAVAQNGFAASVTVTLSGLPVGVTALPSTLTLIPGTAQSITFIAAANAPQFTGNVTTQGNSTGSSGVISESAFLPLTVLPAGGTNDVTTQHNDNARTGQDLHETALTPGNVNTATFGKINFLAADGLVDAQPLYLQNLTVAGQTHNVLYVASEHDSVYAYDADTGTQLWQSSLIGPGETTSDSRGCFQIVPEIGITSTPVIDRTYGTNGAIFVVGMTKDSAGNYHQRLHALDITTGAELAGSPVEVQASYPGSGANSSGGRVIFDPGQYAERAGLLLVNGTVYTAWTSHCDSQPYTGWLIPYSESTLTQGPVLNLTPNGSDGSIWMAGAGPAADASGNIFLLDANGTFDPILDGNGFPTSQDFGNAFLKISTASGTPVVADYFSVDNTVSESGNDVDLGSGGAMLLPDVTDSTGQVHQLAIGTGKDTNIYVVDRNNMGKFNAATNNSIYQELPGALPSGVWSSPAYFNNTVYYGGVATPIEAFPIVNAMLATTPAATSVATFVYPGATPSISANGTSNGIVWAVANTNPAILYAFNAANLQELYDSTQAASGRDSFGPGNKFITPTIANGKVFVGTQTGVAVFGLLP